MVQDSTQKLRLYTVDMDYFFSVLLFSSREKKKGMSVTEAIDHENLYDHTALQAVHINK